MQMLMVVLFIILVGLAISAAQKRNKRLQHYAARLLLSYSLLLGLAGVGELYFRYAYSESGWMFTLAYRNWGDWYWHKNSLGYRDREWNPTDWEGKTTVIVMGDSFASGWGVKDPADRYGDILAEKLGSTFAVMNIARPGDTPPRQLQALKTYIVPDPDLIIYQYYINDIEDAAMTIGVQKSYHLPNYPSLVDESHLLNFAYWSVAPYFSEMAIYDDGGYWAWINSLYQNQAIFDLHHQELNAVMDYVDSIGARMIVVLFPKMDDPVGSIRYLDAIGGIFAERGYTEVLYLYNLVAGWEFSEAVVSRKDTHPSPALHQIVAEMLYEQITH